MTDRGAALWKQIKNKSWLEFYLFSDFWVVGTGVGVKANRNYGLMDTRGQPKWVFSRTPLLYLLSAILLLIFTPTGSAHGERCMPLTQPWSRKRIFGENQNQTKTKSWYSPAMSHLTPDPVFDVIWNEYLCDATQCFLKIIFTWHGAVLQAPGSAGFRDMDTSVRNKMTEETRRLFSRVTVSSAHHCCWSSKHITGHGKRLVSFSSFHRQWSLSHSTPNCILTEYLHALSLFTKNSWQNPCQTQYESLTSLFTSYHSHHHLHASFSRDLIR